MGNLTQSPRQRSYMLIRKQVNRARQLPWVGVSMSTSTCTRAKFPRKHELWVCMGGGGPAQVWKTIDI